MTPPSNSSSSSSSLSNSVIASPCAACKILRRRCVEKCVLAPYFPPNDPLKFTTAHRVFGASNIIKFLQELPECQRSDAVSSMVYEADARLRDPIYGSAGAIFHLQKQVIELQAQLAKAQAHIFNIQSQQINFISPQLSPQQSFNDFQINSPDQSFENINISVYHDNNQEPLWDAIWA